MRRYCLIESSVGKLLEAVDLTVDDVVLLFEGGTYSRIRFEADSECQGYGVQQPFITHFMHRSEVERYRRLEILCDADVEQFTKREQEQQERLRMAREQSERQEYERLRKIYGPTPTPNP